MKAANIPWRPSEETGSVRARCTTQASGWFFTPVRIVGMYPPHQARCLPPEPGYTANGRSRWLSPLYRFSLWLANSLLLESK